LAEGKIGKNNNFMETTMRKPSFAVLLLCLLLLAFAGISHAADYETALTHYYSGEFNKAIRLMKEYVRERPDSKAYYLIGYAYYKLGNHGEANKYFEYAFLIDPEYSPTPALIEAGKWPLPSKPRAKPRMEAPPVEPMVEPEVEAPPVEREGVLKIPVKPKPAPVEETPAEPVAEPEVEAPPAELPFEPETAPPPPPAEEKAVEEMPPPQPEPEAITEKALTLASRIRESLSTRIRKLLPSGIDTEALVLPAGGVVIYLVLSLFCFIIARKRNVSHAWIAWIPVVQLWTLVTALRSSKSTGGGGGPSESEPPDTYFEEDSELDL
jgi:hypothetical protein